MKKTCLALLLLSSLAYAGETATVRVYRRDMGMNGHWPYRAFADGQQIAKLKGGHFVDVQLAAGKHDFRGEAPHQHLVLNLAADKTYYLRADCDSGSSIRPEACAVDSDDGAAETAQLKPQR